MSLLAVMAQRHRMFAIAHRHNFFASNANPIVHDKILDSLLIQTLNEKNENTEQ
jgi:hypothetical protein